MGLLQNIAVLNAEPLHYIGAGTGSATAPAVSVSACMDRARRNRPEQFLNLFASFAGMDPKTGVPSGYLPMSQWSMPRVDGGLASFVEIESSGSLNIRSLALGRAIASSLSAGGNITSAPLSRLYMCLADLSGEGEITEAALSGAVRLIGDLLGEGTINTSPLNILAWCGAFLDGLGDLSGNLETPVGLSSALSGNGAITAAAMVGMVALYAALEGEGAIDPALKFPANLSGDVSGEGDLEDSLLSAILWCVADLLGVGDAVGDMRGKLSMGADITIAGSELTAESVAAAVLNAIAANFDADGTIGQKINAAGTAGDPWTGIMANYTDDAQFGAFIRKLLQTEDFLALK